MAKTKKSAMPKRRNTIALAMILRTGGAGNHKNREHDVATGRSRKPKHKNKHETEDQD